MNLIWVSRLSQEGLYVMSQRAVFALGDAATAATVSRTGKGEISVGSLAGLCAVEIGRTDNCVRRIQNYLHGAQPGGSRRWREQFLILGDIRLYVSGGIECDISCVETRRLMEGRASELESGENVGVWIVNRQHSRRN